MTNPPSHEDMVLIGEALATKGLIQYVNSHGYGSDGREPRGLHELLVTCLIYHYIETYRPRIWTGQEFLDVSRKLLDDVWDLLIDTINTDDDWEW